MAKSIHQKSAANNENIRRIRKLLNDHFGGSPWIDITIAGTLKGITARQASEKIGKLNSIWQIVNHMVSWRKALFGRIKDKPVSTPAGNYIIEITDSSPAAWRKTVKEFERSQKEIIKFLGGQSDELFGKISPTSGYSYYELTMAILMHDIYHLGQIVLIKKMLK